MHLRDLTRYLTELTDNNNRPWFVMNKPRYDILREEFLELVTQVIAELGKFDAQVKFCILSGGARSRARRARRQMRECGGKVA